MWSNSLIVCFAKQSRRKATYETLTRNILRLKNMWIRVQQQQQQQTSSNLCK
jgi:hypothetical protein